MQSPRVRPYQYYDVAISICSTCFRRVDGKIVFEDGRVLLLKRCPEHGAERVLLADDVDYYRRAREVFLKPSEMPARFATPVRWGCPYDCGLCTDHEQHSCLALIEITDHCNLRCPVCYASSGPHRPGYRPLEQVRSMFAALMRSEGHPDVVQLSGGEPTLHPDFFAILDMAREYPIRHLMVNTNGIKLAEDEAFVARLAEYRPGFEIYLQYDSQTEEALRRLRGADLRRIRAQALDNLARHDLSTTLVVTVMRGVNEGEIGSIVDFGVEHPAVRGVTFQPVQHAGRTDGFDPEHDRLTLTEVRRRIGEDSQLFSVDDVLPVPCHPDCLAMAYALRLGGNWLPLGRFIEPGVLLDGGRNTIVLEQEDGLKERLFSVLTAAQGPAREAERLRDLLCCLPQISAPDSLGYADVFRVLILQFLDAEAFDVRSVKKSCVHVVHPQDGRLIPLDTYNLFYRDDLERTRLDPLRAARAGVA